MVGKSRLCNICICVLWGFNFFRFMIRELGKLNFYNVYVYVLYDLFFLVIYSDNVLFSGYR